MESEQDQSNLQAMLAKAETDQSELLTLLQIGRRKGFKNFINRKLIWPFLLDLDSKKIKQAPVFEWKTGLNRSSTDFDQLQKDADRSLSSMKTFEHITKFHLKKKQQAVLTVLDHFFAKNKQLRYIQGFHDVASIFLILFGNSAGYYLMERAGNTYFYDFLTFDFGLVGKSVSRIVYEIVTAEDSQFKDIYSSYEQTQYLIFIVPWILTWFSHNFNQVKTICRIWDYLFCTGPHGIFYLTAGIIISTKKDLKQNCQQLDQPSIQTFYQEQSKNNSINIEQAIKVALQLEQKYDICSLEGYKNLHLKSMIRLNNFQQKIKIHRVLSDSKQRRKNFNEMKKKLIKIVAVGAVSIFLLGVGFYVFRKSDQLTKISQL